jgi:hypothetical protein
MAAGVGLLAVAVILGLLVGAQSPAVLAVALLSMAGLMAVLLSVRPAIEIHPHHLRVGSRAIPWQEVRAVAWSGWILPLVVTLITEDNERIFVVYAGSPATAKVVLRQIRRAAREALIDGVPYREYWSSPGVTGSMPSDGAAAGAAGSSRSADSGIPANRYPLLRQEDEAEVERLYQRLKVVGHLDSKGNDEP